jgi:hypothetical protein
MYRNIHDQQKKQFDHLKSRIKSRKAWCPDSEKTGLEQVKAARSYIQTTLEKELAESERDGTPYTGDYGGVSLEPKQVFSTLGR